MKDKIVETYVEDGQILFVGESGKEYTAGYDYTGIGGVIEPVSVILFEE